MYVSVFSLISDDATCSDSNTIFPGGALIWSLYLVGYLLLSLLSITLPIRANFSRLSWSCLTKNPKNWRIRLRQMDDSQSPILSFWRMEVLFLLAVQMMSSISIVYFLLFLSSHQSCLNWKYGEDQSLDQMHFCRHMMSRFVQILVCFEIEV